MPEPTITEWRIHIGAHKTATTHLQEVLGGRADEIAEMGATFLPVRQARQALPKPRTRARRIATRLLPALAPVLNRPRPEAAQSGLQAAARVRGPMLISDENLLGGVFGALHPRLYPALSTLRFLEVLARRAPLRVFLAIRSPDRLLPSAYAEGLKAGPIRDGHLARIVARWRDRPPLWSELVARIARTVPSARLHVWDHADYARHWREIHRRFTGLPLPDGPDLPGIDRNRTPTAAGIAAACALPAHMPRRAAAVRAIYAQHMPGPGAPVFDPLSPQDRARLQAAFAEDLARLAASDPGLVWRF